MKEEYWELFMTSGKIDDYLNYKNSRKADGSSGRKERRESDYTDRDSTLYDAGRRVGPACCNTYKRTGKDLGVCTGGKTPEQSACRCAQPVFFRNVYDV